MDSVSSIQSLSPVQSLLSPKNVQSSLSGLAVSAHALEFHELPCTPYWHIPYTKKTPIWKRKEWGTLVVTIQTSYQILLERNDKSSFLWWCSKFTTFPWLCRVGLSLSIVFCGHLCLGHWGVCPPWGLPTVHSLPYFGKVRNLRVTLGGYQRHGCFYLFFYF